MPDSFPNLRKLAELLKTLPSTEAVEIGAHTDKYGSEANQLKLTQTRAVVVRNELIKLGVKAKSLTAKGYGSSKSVASNTTEANRAKNNRIDFAILPL